MDYSKIKDKTFFIQVNTGSEIQKSGVSLDQVEALIQKCKDYNIKIGEENVMIVKGQDEERHLYCDLDLRLLNRILHKKAHWNNAEIGTHINFKRIPNKMDLDVHTCMSFFNL